MTTTIKKPRQRRLPKDFRLDAGAHESPETGMCVMELSSYLAREPFSDRPACVSPAIGAFLRSWNDNVDDDFRQRLRPYAKNVIGTRTTEADEQTRAWLATDWLVRVQAPAWLDLAGLTERASELRALPPLTSSEIAVAVQSVIEHARNDASAAGDAARAAAWAAAGDAARAAAWAAAGDAAGTAAWAAAGDAAGAAARAAAWDAARDAAGTAADKKLAPTVAMLQESAFTLLNAMIAVGAPGADAGQP